MLNEILRVMDSLSYWYTDFGRMFGLVERIIFACIHLYYLEMFNLHFHNLMG
jgi:hypothetical protein